MIHIHIQNEHMSNIAFNSLINEQPSKILRLIQRELESDSPQKAEMNLLTVTKLVNIPLGNKL